MMPLLHLEPPHYDGVQSLAVTNNALGADAALFSGSRDSGIKRWDLRNGELKQVSESSIEKIGSSILSNFLKRNANLFSVVE